MLFPQPTWVAFMFFPRSLYAINHSKQSNKQFTLFVSRNSYMHKIPSKVYLKMYNHNSFSTPTFDSLWFLLIFFSCSKIIKYQPTVKYYTLLQMLLWFLPIWVFEIGMHTTLCSLVYNRLIRFLPFLVKGEKPF